MILAFYPLYLKSKRKEAHPLRERLNCPKRLLIAIGEGWLSFLMWLPPLKLSKVGLFRGSHGCRPTTTGPVGPLLHLDSS